MMVTPMLAAVVMLIVQLSGPVQPAVMVRPARNSNLATTVILMLADLVTLTAVVQVLLRPAVMVTIAPR